MGLEVGDLIGQRSQAGISARLVIALTANPDVVIVYDYASVISDVPKFRRVFTWGHSLTMLSTAISRQEAQLHKKEFDVVERSQAQW